MQRLRRDRSNRFRGLRWDPCSFPRLARCLHDRLCPGRSALSAPLKSRLGCATLRSMPKPTKQRVGQLLVGRGLAESRTRAQALVMAGQVYSGDRRIRWPWRSSMRPAS